MLIYSYMLLAASTEPAQLTQAVREGVGFDPVKLLDYGAIGVLALCFITMIYLFWKKDKQTAETIQMLQEAQNNCRQAGDRLKSEEDKLEKMIEVVQQNTQAMTCVRMAVEQNTQVIQRLDLDLSQKLDTLSRDLQQHK